MLVKTQGIILQTIRHSDSGIIAHVLSEEYGMISVMVKGIFSKKRGHMTAYFQPLQILNMEIYYREKRSLQSVKEVSLSEALTGISSDFIKSSIAFFMGEVLRKTLNEAEPNRKIYNYVRESVIFLDSNKRIANFHIGFLIGLAGFLGIAPAGTYSAKESVFDMLAGQYVTSLPLHGYYMESEFSALLYSFSLCSLEDCNKISLNGNRRSKFLEVVLTYFSLHLPGLSKIKSLEVFTELFS